MTIKFIVDSTTDLPSEWLKKWDIPVVTAYVNFEDESFPDDGIALPHAEFYRRLTTAKTLPRTSAMPPGLAQDAIEKQLQNAEHVVVFSLASQFSSIYNTFQLAARNVDPQRVTVVDSGTLSMSIGWQVEAAVKAAEGGATLEEVLAAARHVRERQKLWVVIDTLEYLRRSGRVNYMIASIGSLLQIKPIIDVRDGKVITSQRVRTMSRAIQTMIDLIHTQAPLERAAVLHTNFPQGAEDLKAKLADVLPPDTIVSEATPAIGVHIGPNCLGIALVRKNP